jgi:glucose-1-phosphate thymidylyltransferase
LEAATAVILARGLDSRMRREDAAAVVDPAQQRVAAAGLKAMIPDERGRPFLDHILTALAVGGVTRVVLVVAPDAEPIRAHYHQHPTRRLDLEWAVQAEPLGTANAVLAAEALVGSAPFLVLNADNLYPVEAIRALVALGESGLIAFDRDALVREGNITSGRIAAFALVEIDPRGYLVALMEKPDPDIPPALSGNWISMNLWRFDHSIFDACRDVAPSSRGELELPEAVALAVRRGQTLRAVPMYAGVLDLSHRADIAAVAARLADQVTDP